MRVTEKQIEAAKSPKGGWTAATLAQWGVPWPPPKGWKEALLAGAPIPEAQEKAEKDTTSDDFLRALCVELIGRGHAGIIHRVPGLVDHFGGCIPTDEEIAESKRGLRNDKGGDVPW